MSHADPKLQQLEEAVQSAALDRERVDALNALASEMRARDPRRALTLAQEASDLAQGISHLRGWAAALATVGSCYGRLSDQEAALRCLEQGLTLSREVKDALIEAQCLHGIGLVHILQSNYPDALKYTLEALNLRRAAGDFAGAATSLNNIGGVYQMLEDPHAALPYFRESLQACEELDDAGGISNALTNLGISSTAMDEHERALEYHQRSIPHARQGASALGEMTGLSNVSDACCNLDRYPEALDAAQQALVLARALEYRPIEAAALLNIGRAHREMGKYDQARSAFEEAVQVARAAGDKQREGQTLYHLGNLHLKFGDLRQARACLNQSADVATLLQLHKTLAQIHEALANVSEQEGDLGSALKHHRTFHRMEEEVLNEKAARRSQALMIQMEVEKTQKEAELHRIQNAELAQANRALASANARLEALATTDPLTGLPNHRAMIAALDAEIERSASGGHPCAVLFLDVDHFKAVNDAYGHAAGDTALREFAALVRDCLREPDTLGRWGGEEFVAILSQTGPREAQAVAECVRNAVARQNFTAAGGLHLTCSIGVAFYPTSGAQRDALLHAADEAMYAAKHLGRDQVRAAGEQVVTALGGGAAQGDVREVTALAGVVDALAMLTGAKDRYTARHAQQVARLAVGLCETLGLSPAETQPIELAARLLDLGKIAVPDAILQKPDALAEDEWERMRLHPAIGAEAVSRVPSLRCLAPLIRAHHERWDGQGYPDGLAGAAIPRGARILAVADAYAAMTSRRPYRSAYTEGWAMAEMCRGAGTQFDPSVVAALKSLLPS